MDRAPWIEAPLTMPAFDWKLNDAQAEAVSTYIRQSWGNAAGVVSEREVQRLRDVLRRDTRF